MKLTLRFGCLIVLIATATVSLSANTITLTLINGGSNVMGGVYVGPYNLTETNGSTKFPVKLVCDDFKDEVFVGESWKVLASTFPTLSNVKWSGQTVNYEKVGWLIEQMFSPTNSSNARAVGDIQWAIWDIFYPGASNNDPYGKVSSQDKTNIANWLTLAQNNYASGNYSNLVIYTPIPGSQVPSKYGPPQEYFGWNPPTPTPEPASLLLVGTGMFALAGFRRRAFSSGKNLPR
jgi:hypothetical protein